MIRSFFYWTQDISSANNPESMLNIVFDKFSSYVLIILLFISQE